MRIWIGMADVATAVSAPGTFTLAYLRMPVRIVVAFAHGVSTDTVARIIAQVRS